MRLNEWLDVQQYVEARDDYEYDDGFGDDTVIEVPERFDEDDDVVVDEVDLDEEENYDDDLSDDDYEY